MTPFAGPDASMQLLAHPIEWHLVTESVVERRLKPLIGAKIEHFLGTADPEMIEFLLETLVPKPDIPMQRPIANILADVEEAYGETEEEKREAKSLVEDVWRCVVWETEKMKLLMLKDGGQKQVLGLDKEVDEVEIAEVL